MIPCIYEFGCFFLTILMFNCVWMVLKITITLKQQEKSSIFLSHPPPHPKNSYKNHQKGHDYSESGFLQPYNFADLNQKLKQYFVVTAELNLTQPKLD